MNKKNNLVSSEDHYTNLTLIIVAEAMVLLIMQLLIYNSFNSLYVDAAMNVAVPVILCIATIVTLASAVLYFFKKKSALISFVFGAYVTLLMCVIRYIPNEFSASLGRLVPNYLKGQKIGMILSVIYVVAGILYCVLAEKRRRKLKNK
ncbi:MAG: hypothetical protein IKT39_01170 [Clostridia bacterium]|nr:hypothetical protein [Clostridia bacterium]